jgi:hypothetical protein
MAHRGTDNAAGRRSAERADARALLPGRQSAAGASNGQCTQQRRHANDAGHTFESMKCDVHGEHPPDAILDAPAAILFTTTVCQFKVQGSDVGTLIFEQEAV